VWKERENGNFANCHGDGAHEASDQLVRQQITESITEVEREQASTSGRLVAMFIGSEHVDKGFVLSFFVMVLTAALCLALLQPIC
jgi:hypothetical protein